MTMADAFVCLGVFIFFWLLGSRVGRGWNVFGCLINHNWGQWKNLEHRSILSDTAWKITQERYCSCCGRAELRETFS